MKMTNSDYFRLNQLKTSCSRARHFGRGGASESPHVSGHSLGINVNVYRLLSVGVPSLVLKGARESCRESLGESEEWERS